MKKLINILFFTMFIIEVFAQSSIKKNINETGPKKTVQLVDKSLNTKIEIGAKQQLELVFVKGDTFNMELNYNVLLSDFYIMKYEVTQEQWNAVLGKNPSYFKNCTNCPVENVSWNDIQKFISKLKIQTGKNFQLPTEAEWVYAARGGNKSNGFKFSGSNNIDEIAWYEINSEKKTHTVGQKQPNELGIYDMTGNVWEFCSDWSGGMFSNNLVFNPKGDSVGTNKVVRGGSWCYYQESCKLTQRSFSDPNEKDRNLGFRLVLEIKSTKINKKLQLKRENESKKHTKAVENKHIFNALAQIVNIPNPKLKSLIVKKYDNNYDGEIQIEEAQKVKYIIMEVPNRVWFNTQNDKQQILTKLDGIEKFPNLEKIELYDSHLDVVDFSNNKKLKSIKIYHDRVEASIVNISQNDLLTEVSLINFNLKEINLPKNAKLEKLELKGNQLSYLDLTNYPNLKILDLSRNLFKHISLENNTQLEEFNCSDNWLYQIDISHLTKLKLFGAEQIGIASINLKFNIQLEYLYLSQNHLKTIDISHCPNLIALYISGNRINNIATIGNSNQHQLKIVQDEFDPSEVLNIYSSKNKFENKFNFKKDMVWMEKSNIYVSKYETTNEEYNDFLHHLIKDSLTKLGSKYIYNLYYPDSTLWLKEFKNNIVEPMTEYYNQNPQFGDFPVVAIDYWAAKKYCDWMTQKYGNGMYKFRLPTYNEYLSYAKNADSQFAGGWKKVLDENNQFLFNFRPGRFYFENEQLDNNSTYETFFNPQNQLYTKVYRENNGNFKQPDNFFKIEFIYENKIYFEVKNKLNSFKLEEKISFLDSNKITERNHDKIIFTPGNYYQDGYMFTAPNRTELYIKYQKDNLDKRDIIKLKSNKSAYKADNNGLYHVAGNVSEWVNYENSENPNFTKAIGGNWNSFEQDCHYDSSIYVEKGFSSTTIGFRIVAEKNITQ